MRYDPQDFRRLGIFKEKPKGEIDSEYISSGRNVIGSLNEKIQKLLSQRSDTSHSGDFSRQDLAIITAMLGAGFSIEDTYTTFASSARGKFAAERHPAFDDYLQRTVKKGASFLGRNGNGKSNGHINVNFSKTRKSDGDKEGILSTLASEVEVEKIRWLWTGYIPASKITILAGDPGMGKSTISIDIVSRVSRGTHLPCSRERTVFGTCLIASAEDAAADTIIPRLIVAKANLKRISVMREVKIGDESHYLAFPRDLERFREKIVRTGARLVIIDPLNAFLEKGTDTYKDQDIRLVLAPLESIAEETGAAILIVAHLNKKEEASTLYRVGGSIGFIGAARSVLAVSKTQKGDVRVLYSLKSNLAKTPPTLAYDTVQGQKERQRDNEWQGENRVRSSGINWKGKVDFDPTNMASVTDESKAETEVEDFLHQVLLESEVPSEEVYAEAKKAGISRGALTRVKTALGIKVRKNRRGWVWTWPE
jgi:archaellum biogenesis ATPase FlaH